ncbi:MAG: hypothetical protein R3A79_01560 [Nannocystaceae bacterium]
MAPTTRELSIVLTALPDGPAGEYRLDLRRSGDRWVLWTPGEARGPDVIVPTRPELDAWVAKRCARWVEPTWDCQYTFRDDDALADFLDFVGEPLPEA